MWPTFRFQILDLVVLVTSLAGGSLVGALFGMRGRRGRFTRVDGRAPLVLGNGFPGVAMGMAEFLGVN